MVWGISPFLQERMKSHSFVVRSLVILTMATVGLGCSSGPSPASTPTGSPATPAPTAGAPAPVRAGASVESELVEHHNAARAQVGTKPLSWSRKAASVAKAYAER